MLESIEADFETMSSECTSRLNKKLTKLNKASLSLRLTMLFFIGNGWYYYTSEHWTGDRRRSMAGIPFYLHAEARWHRPATADPWTTSLVSAAWTPTARSTAVEMQATLLNAAASASRITSAYCRAGLANTASPNANVLRYGSHLSEDKARSVLDHLP